MTKAGKPGGLPKGKAGKGPSDTGRKEKAPGPKKLNQAGYGTGKNPKGPPKIP